MGGRCKSVFCLSTRAKDRDVVVKVNYPTLGWVKKNPPCLSGTSLRKAFLCYHGTVMLTLSEALKTDRLREFIAQEEQRGVAPADRKKLDVALKRLVTKRPKESGRTSRSSSGDGSNGT